MMPPLDRAELVAICNRLETLTAYVREIEPIEMHAEATLGREWARVYLLAKQAEKDLKRMVLAQAMGEVERLLHDDTAPT